MVRVIVTLTITPIKETVIEGEALVFNGVFDGLDELERRGLGFWLTDWKYCELHAAKHDSKVFVPWTSCLFVEEVKVKGGDDQCCRIHG